MLTLVTVPTPHHITPHPPFFCHCSVWVGRSFTNNRFQFVWPIVFLRWFASVFFQILDIMTLTLFLMALDCQYFSRAPEQTFYNQEFPGVCEWAPVMLSHSTR
jgi:hypothetical protein